MKSSIVYPSQITASAQIITPPNKVVYTAGEKFDPTGMVIAGIDGNGQMYQITEFNSINTGKSLTTSDTFQEFYVMLGAQPVLIKQAITVQDTPGTFFTVTANIHSECVDMFNSVSGSTIVVSGGNATFSASVKSDYEFTGWYDAAGNLISIANPYVFQVLSNIVYYAKAKAKVIPPTTYTATAGIYTGCDAMFNSVSANPTSGTTGTEITFAASVKDDYEFEGWFNTSGGILVSHNNPYTVAISDSNITLNAKAKQKSTDPDYLCFTAAEDGVRIQFQYLGLATYDIPEFEYSFDKLNWQTWQHTSGSWGSGKSANYEQLVLINNQSIYFRGNNTHLSFIGQSGGYTLGAKFITIGHFYCSGNIMSLLDKTCNLTSIPTDYCFSNLFKECDGLLTTPKLPATALTNYCYYKLFYNCYSLTTVPELPATIIPISAYESMFELCIAITSMPELPATILNNKCYYRMFYGCSSLINTKDLPATILQSECYSQMFQSCIALISPPLIKATTLAESCCIAMFRNCTKLQYSPELLAIEDDIACYSYMFYGCTSLQIINNIYTTPIKSNSFYRTFKECSNVNNINVKFINYAGGDKGLSYDWLTTNIADGVLKCYHALTWNTYYNLPPEGWTVEYLD